MKPTVKLHHFLAVWLKWGTRQARDKPGWRSWWRVGLIGQPTRQSYDVQTIPLWCLRHPKVAGSSPAPGTSQQFCLDLTVVN